MSVDSTWLLCCSLDRAEMEDTLYYLLNSDPFLTFFKHSYTWGFSVKKILRLCVQSKIKNILIYCTCLCLLAHLSNPSRILKFTQPLRPIKSLNFSLYFLLLFDIKCLVILSLLYHCYHKIFWIQTSLFPWSGGYPRISLCHDNEKLFRPKEKRAMPNCCLCFIMGYLKRVYQCGPVICIISVPMRLMRESSHITSGCFRGCVGEASIQRQSTHSKTRMQFCRGRCFAGVNFLTPETPASLF